MEILILNNFFEKYDHNLNIVYEIIYLMMDQHNILSYFINLDLKIRMMVTLTI